ncbi:MAG: hypothetical protein HYV07_01395 [Deltaproteobacteria bacterium]|nr:hypothetical protein [Deltaproteobacteria bacterium]
MRAWLDAGALIAVDRKEREMSVTLRVLHRERVPVWTTAPVIAQVWRDGKTQANLARALQGVAVRDLDVVLAPRVGELQAKARTSDVVDAHLASLVSPGDLVLTSDPDDLRRLLKARGVRARIVRA